MAERLKQIWAGFEETTTRRLTGKGVENIIVPHRTDYSAVDQEFLPEGFEDPSSSAFSALHEELAAQQNRFGRKNKSRKQNTNCCIPYLKMVLQSLILTILFVVNF